MKTTTVPVASFSHCCYDVPCTVYLWTMQLSSSGKTHIAMRAALVR